MRPTLLKPDMMVIVADFFGKPRQMKFVRRDRQPCRSAENIFQCDDYRGQYGAKDTGICTLTDYRVSSFVQPVRQPAGQAAPVAAAA